MASREIWSLAGTFSTWVKGFVILLILSVCASSLQARNMKPSSSASTSSSPVPVSRQPRATIRSARSPRVTRYSATPFSPSMWWTFPPIPANPSTCRVLDPQGVIVDAYVLEHHEPILLIGIPEQKLHDFSAKYQGIRADQRVVVGRSSDSNAVTIDAVTGATVTVMVVNEIVMRAAHEVAVSLEPDRGRQRAAEDRQRAPGRLPAGQLDRADRQWRDPASAPDSRADRRSLQGHRGRRHRRTPHRPPTRPSSTSTPRS